eukprot:TRINITY_DN4386_c0_g1_i1.p1 TRINITY_DN4386_c0_g1~~TRINITY_DN4386_c0_g1_i1.p1  ORF type:complete len:288 (+),score=110.91 TRINITY_DN4386_c0_g1_i1:151-1014(+)
MNPGTFAALNEQLEKSQIHSERLETALRKVKGMLDATQAEAMEKEKVWQIKFTELEEKLREANDRAKAAEKCSRDFPTVVTDVTASSPPLVFGGGLPPPLPPLPHLDGRGGPPPPPPGGRGPPPPPGGRGGPPPPPGGRGGPPPPGGRGGPPPPPPLPQFKTPSSGQRGGGRGGDRGGGGGGVGGRGGGGGGGGSGGGSGIGGDSSGMNDIVSAIRSGVILKKTTTESRLPTSSGLGGSADPASSLAKMAQDMALQRRKRNEEKLKRESLSLPTSSVELEMLLSSFS